MWRYLKQILTAILILAALTTTPLPAQQPPLPPSPGAPAEGQPAAPKAAEQPTPVVPWILFVGATIGILFIICTPSRKG
jgi:hypothetical protein